MADITDSDSTSNEFFFITGIDQIVGAGKNSFTINATKKILPNSTVDIQGFDALNNSIFIESIKPKYARFGGSTEFGETYYIKIDDNTPSGIGYIQIKSNAVDLGDYTGSWDYYNGDPYKVSNGQRLPFVKRPDDPFRLPTNSITWKRNILIDPTTPTKSEVVFFDQPTIEIFPKVYKVPQFPFQPYAIGTGSFSSMAISPKNNHNGDYDQKNELVVYQINRTNGGYFDSAMEGEDIRLKNISVKKFVYTNNSNGSLIYEGPITTDFIATVKRVINNNSILISIPFTTVSDILSNINQDSEYAKNNLVDIRGYSVSDDKYKQNVYYKKNFYCLSIDSGQYEVIYKSLSEFQQRAMDGNGHEIYKMVVNIKLKKLRTLCGKLKSYKVFGRSLNIPQSKTIFSEGRIEPSETIIGSGFDNGFKYEPGRFYSQNHMNRYWMTSGVGIQFVYDNNVLIDGASIGHADNSDQSSYVIFKDDAIEPSRTSGYVNPTILPESYWYAHNQSFVNESAFPTSSFSVLPILSPYQSSQENLFNGTIHNSNPIELIGKSLYRFSMRVRSKPNNTSDSIMYIYFVNGDGRKKIGTIDSSYNLGADELYSNTFFIPSTQFGTIILVPVKGNWTISNLSLVAYESVGYSIENFSINVPINNTIQNEMFEFEVELYDSSDRLSYGTNSSNFNYNKTFKPLNKKILVNVNGMV